MSRSRLITDIRKLEQYEEWKRAVFIRDRFTCQNCGRRNGRKRVIEAHHVTAISALIKQYEVGSLEEATICPALWDTSNGQTLCKSCHELTESYPVQLRTKKRKR